MSTDTNYITLAQVKRYLPIEDAEDDDVLTMVLAGACRRIDSYCDSRFYTTSSDETRYETALDSMILIPGLPIASLTSVAIDDGNRTYATALAAANYELYPWQIATGEAYTQIRITPTGVYTFPGGDRMVKIVGKFGYGSVPDAVKSAALIMVSRLWARRAAPFGIAGATEIGQLMAIKPIDPDVQELLAPYRCMGIIAI